MHRPALIIFAVAAVFSPVAVMAQSCSFSVSNINFGNVDTLAGNSVNRVGTVDINCTGGLLGATFRICLNLNQGSGGAVGGMRRMSGPGGAVLNYGLYQDSARSIPWGSVAQTSLGQPLGFNLTVPIGGSVSTTRTIYGQVLSGQQGAATGAYASTFSGVATGARFLYQAYLLLPPNCSGVIQNETSPTFALQANVAPNCRVTAQNIDFGSHGFLDANVDAAGGLGVTCTPDTPYTVGLNNGLTGTGPTARQMTSGAQAVNYGLYKDAARSQPWGNSGGDLATGTGAGAAQNLPVYGRVPPQVTPAPGTYTDTVIVTVTY